MDRTVDRLRIHWTENPPSSWVEDLESMAEGYPFEKKRRSLQKIDRGRQIRQVLSTQESGQRTYLGASFDSGLVGWLMMETNPLHEQHLPVPVLDAKWELIQRNRDDIREVLIDSVKERYPGALIHFQQPAQNRTARAFLGRYPGMIRGAQELFLAHQEPELAGPPPSLPPDLQSRPLSGASGSELQSLVEHYTKSRLHVGPIFSRHTASRLHLEWIQDRVKHPGAQGEIIYRDRRPAAMILVRMHPDSFPAKRSTASVSYIQVHPDFQNQGLGRILLERGLTSLKQDGVDYVEVKVCAENESACSFYRRLGFEPVTKRRHFYLLPDNGLDRPL